MGSMPSFCLGLFFTLAGLWLFLSGIKDYRDTIDSKQWLSIDGQITNATIHRSLSRGMPYYLKVAYTYFLFGRTYVGGRTVFGSSARYSSRKEAEAAMQKYQPGQRVTVYYNPKNHAKTVLEPGRVFGAVGDLVAGGIFFLIGAILLAGEVWQIMQYLFATLVK
jgi:hypothetical protein